MSELQRKSAQFHLNILCWNQDPIIANFAEMITEHLA